MLAINKMALEFVLHDSMYALATSAQILGSAAHASAFAARQIVASAPVDATTFDSVNYQPLPPTSMMTSLTKTYFNSTAQSLHSVASGVMNEGRYDENEDNVGEKGSSLMGNEGYMLTFSVNNRTTET
jgi:hypothetical protein